MWADIENALQFQFGQRAQPEDARALVSQQRRDGEKLGAFAADLYQNPGYPDFLMAIQEELMLQAFLRGLQLHPAH